MGEICSTCRFIRSPAGAYAPASEWNPPKSASQMAALAKRRREGLIRLEQERATAAQTSFAPLTGPPRYLDWCAAKSKPAIGEYFFTEWQIAAHCDQYKCRQEVESCERCTSGFGACAVGWNQPNEVLPGPHDPNETTAASVGPPTALSSYEVPLGRAVSIERVHIGSAAAQQVDFRFKDSASPPPRISGKGLFQSYLIFGGPGAGKTTFFKYILEKVLSHPSDPGCLLLDPKGKLAPWITKLATKVRPDETVIEVSSTARSSFNVLGSKIPAPELGRLLADVVMAQAGAVDDGWQVLAVDLLESAVVVLDALGSLTIRQILDEILYPQKMQRGGRPVQAYGIEYSAQRVLASPQSTSAQRNAATRVREYLRAEERQRRYVRQLIEKCLGDLRNDEWAHLSQAGGLDPYDAVIKQGRLVTVSLGYGTPAFQQSLLILMKAVFQQYALAQLAERSLGDRFFVLACDEYAKIVTEGSSGLVSDAAFFSQSREAGCMSLLALQSIATARAQFPASMRDRWDGILGNIAGRIFMRLNDPDTAKLASDLVGQRQETIRTSAAGVSTQGSSLTDSYSMTDRAEIPDWVFTARLPTFYGLAQGSFDGALPVSEFVRVPTEEVF